MTYQISTFFENVSETLITGGRTVKGGVGRIGGADGHSTLSIVLHFIEMLRFDTGYEMDASNIHISINQSVQKIYQTHI